MWAAKSNQLVVYKLRASYHFLSFIKLHLISRAFPVKTRQFVLSFFLLDETNGPLQGKCLADSGFALQNHLFARIMAVHVINRWLSD